MTPNNPPTAQKWNLLRIIGPGIAVAATGVGAGDMIAATVAGSRYGFTVVWAALLGALFKFALNEGLARWQLATGTTILEGWIRHLGRWVQIYFLIYLVLWTFIVSAALIAACGLAAHAIAPGLSVNAWGALHSALAATLVLLGSYQHFETLMKVFIGAMFVAIIGCALFVAPPLQSISASITHISIPAGSTGLILGVIGGVGGSLTLLSYGYWIREKDWQGAQYMRTVRADLSVAYLLTGIFGAALILLAAHTIHPKGLSVKGSRSVLVMAQMLKETLGPIGFWTFLIGFWGAVSTSMLGVWQSVPYMFCDFIALRNNLPPAQREALLSSRSRHYRGYLLYMALPPLALLLLGKPVGLIILYSVIGSLFMPFLAATLLYMNSRSSLVGTELKNRAPSIILLSLSLLLFAFLGIRELIKAWHKIF